MSTKSARNKLNGHGRVICSSCERIVITCKCVKCGDNIQYDTCDDCEKLKAVPVKQIGK